MGGGLFTQLPSKNKCDVTVGPSVCPQWLPLMEPGGTCQPGSGVVEPDTGQCRPVTWASSPVWTPGLAGGQLDKPGTGSGVHRCSSMGECLFFLTHICFGENVAQEVERVGW